MPNFDQLAAQGARAAEMARKRREEDEKDEKRRRGGSDSDGGTDDGTGDGGAPDGTPSLAARRDADEHDAEKVVDVSEPSHLRPLPDVPVVRVAPWIMVDDDDEDDDEDGFEL